jgi:hypothetical protein
MQLVETGEDTEDDAIATGAHEGEGVLPLAPTRAKSRSRIMARPRLCWCS